MAGTVLSEQYVDIISRNLKETMDALRSIQRMADEAGVSFRKMRDAASESAGRTSSSLAGAGQAAARMRDGVADAGNRGTASLAGLRQAASMLPGALGSISAAAGPVGVALAAIGAAIALVTQGFQGTSEMEQFGQAMTMIAREAAALFAPAVQLAADVLKMMVGIFQGTGVAGQQLLGRLTPIGAAFEVLANPAVQTAFRGLVAAFGQLVQAAQPLLNLVANIGSVLLDVFVVGPLVQFTRALTFTVLLLKEIVSTVTRLVGIIPGLNSLMQSPAGQRRQVTLAQTGTEDATATFQRIQEAVLRAGGPKTEEEKQTNYLSEIDAKVKEIVGKFDASIGQVQAIVSFVSQLVTNPSAAAQGVQNNAGIGLNLGLSALGGLLTRR